MLPEHLPSDMTYPTFHNTTGLRGRRLREAIEQAATQEDKVRTYFAWHPNALLTPFDVQERVFGGRVPITSVRRAMTNLTERGVLVKTGHTKRGEYGQPNHCWRLRHEGEREGQMGLF